jgi:hypothetical protein
MLQLKPNMLKTIYVISNMNLNYNLGIHPSGHSSPQWSFLSPNSPTPSGSIPEIPKFM